MSCINIGIFSEHLLLQEGLCSLVESIEDIQISMKGNSIDKLLPCTDLKKIHILILHPYIGAKGFLAKESDKNDLLEAIYTLRSGHDYYSKSITKLLLKKYITGLKSGESLFVNKDIKCLSSRELEILKLWGNSYTNNEISEELFISVRTVESHKNHIMQKLNMKTAVDLVKFAIKNNIIEV